MKENIKFELAYDNRKQDSIHVLVNDLSERKSSIIIHNITFDWPTQALLLKVKLKDRQKVEIYHKTNEQPNDKIYDTSYSFNKQKYIEQVVKLAKRNGTAFIGIKLGEYIFYHVLLSISILICCVYREI